MPIAIAPDSTIASAATIPEPEVPPPPAPCS
jgi:hypothetical protein